jgi:DNA modification methylase
MPTVRLVIGDVRDALDRFEADGETFDLLVTSPPFLALRSYLPADHPDKHREIGSEPTPALFLDTLYGLTAQWGRLLPEWASICVELGDTMSGSGGAGGDYADGGWRAGQPKFRQVNNSRPARWSHVEVHWLAALIDAEGSIHVHEDNRDPTPRYAPMVSVGMNSRVMLDRAALITGVGEVKPLKPKGYRWLVTAQQARYVLLNIWPHLMIKQEQAKAAIELARHVEECRFGVNGRATSEAIEYRQMIRRFIMNLNEKGGNYGKYPTDWTPPTPHVITHSMHGGPDTPLPKSMCILPHAYTLGLAYGHNPLTGTPHEAGQWRIRNVITWARPNPPVGSLGKRNPERRTGDHKFRPACSFITVACRGTGRFFDLDVVRHEHVNGPHAVGSAMVNGQPRTVNGGESNPAGAPPLDWHTDHLDGDWLWKLATAPFKGWTETVRQVRVEVDAGADGSQRTTSPNCPVHGSPDHPGSNAPDGEHATDESSRSEHNDGRPVPAPDADSPPIPSRTDLTASDADPGDLAATPRSTSSSRTAPAPATSPADTPSARTSTRTGGTSDEPVSSVPDPDTDESSTSAPGSDVQDGTPPHIECTCKWYRVESRSESTSHYATYPLTLPRRLILAMCPAEVCQVCGWPRERIGVDTYVDARGRPAPGETWSSGIVNGRGAHSNKTAVRTTTTTLGWTDCGHNHYRSGRVLDPFGGSGTTAVAAALENRDCTLIDLDPRNVDLVRRRLAEALHIVSETVDGNVWTWTVEPPLPAQKQQVLGQLTLLGGGT